jgi:hypothetical protein
LKEQRYSRWQVPDECSNGDRCSCAKSTARMAEAVTGVLRGAGYARIASFVAERREYVMATP